MAGPAGKSQLCLFLLSVCLPQFLGFIMLQAPLSTKSISVKGLLWKWKRLEGVDTSISFLDRKDLFCFAQETFTHLCLSPIPPLRPTPGDLKSLPLTYSWILKLSALTPQWFSSNKPTWKLYSHPVPRSKISPLPKCSSACSPRLFAPSFTGLCSWLTMQEQGRRSSHTKQASGLLQIPKEPMAWQRCPVARRYYRHNFAISWLS